jgi:hypothetical protein
MGTDEADAHRRGRCREHHPEAGQQPNGNRRPQFPHAHLFHGSNRKTSCDFPDVSQGMADFRKAGSAIKTHGVGVPTERVHLARCWTADIAFGHASFACGI